MKKFVAILLTLMLVLGIGAAVADEIQYDVTPIITKTYQVNNGTAPAETFTYQFTGKSYTDTDGNVQESASIPAIADVTITYADAITTTTGKSAEVRIDASQYELGVYTYEVTEKAGQTAGVTYSTEKLYLVLTIVRDEASNKHYVAALHYENKEGSKTDNDLTNEYDSGSLTVTKQIKGNMADMHKKFTFMISFDAGSKDWTNAIVSNSTAGTWSEDGKTYTIALGHNESVSLSNIPAGLTYDVTEEVVDGYVSEAVFSDAEKVISADDTDTATFTNTKENSNIDMGVTTENLPYVLLIGFVVLAGAALLIKRKAHNN